MTGGGIFPALAVLQALGDKAQEVLWIGSESGMEQTITAKYQIPFKAIPAAGLHGVGLRQLPANLSRLWRGWKQAKRAIVNFQPDVMFFTGGYLAGPVALAGRRIPKVAFIPDIEPGLALRFLIRMADSITAATKDTLAFLTRKENVDITGYPVRADFCKWSKTEAKKVLDLHARKPVVLVVGGSSGARSMNNAVFAQLEELLQIAQIIHISGKVHWQDANKIKNALPVQVRQDYHVFSFLEDEMGAALASADLAVSRAGASSLGELPFFGLPAILVPYPHAWRYQKTNAEYLVKKGAAVLLPDENLEQDLLATITNLLANPQHLERMSKSMQALSKPDAAKKIAQIIVQTANIKKEMQTL